ncbi:putative nucleic acid-binding Zn ribbon protein [Paraburkholderia sp. MM5384-R2]|nr:putative nucleic acid-binding Zn ribbon protein [Paraburkholderia sp. MM5384-R2]
METLTKVRYTYACAACGYRGRVVRPDASHARKLAICARCDGQVWLSVDAATAPGEASAVFSAQRLSAHTSRG